MKRQFMKSLMALCTGVMTLVAASSLFVSCYDDSALREDLKEFDAELDDLASKVAAIEELQTRLDELTARVNALYTLKFQVNENNELQYSFDGGQTWTDTRIVLGSAECDCEPAEPCDHVCPPCQYVPCEHECPEVSVVDNGETVTFKVGDAEFTVVKPQEVVFEIRAGKVFFESEGTMKVSVKTTGIDDLTVIAAPKGWYAEVNAEGMVEITAPNYEDCQEGYGYDENDEYYEVPAKYAATGFVKVHACSADGKCMVGKIPVEVASQPLIVKAYSGNAYFTLAGTASWWNATFYYGVSEKANLEEDTADLIKRMNAGDWSLSDDYFSNWGEYTEVKESIADLLGEEPQVGKEYVVWALVESSSEAKLQDLVLAYYSPVEVNITENEAAKTAYNIDVTVEVLGADSFVGVAMPESQLQWTSVEELQEQMVMAMAEGMYYGKLHTSTYVGSALDIAAETSYSMTGNYAPDSDVYVFVLPIDGRSKEDYTVEDVVYAKFSTSALAAGGSIDLTAKQVTSYMGEVYDYDIYDYVMQEITLDPYTQLGVEVTPSATTDWTAFYFTWMDEATYADYGEYEEDLVDYLLENTYGNSPAELKSWPYYAVEKVAPNTTMHFVAFIVDADGKYGKIAHVEATSKELVKADLVWVEPFISNVVDGVLKNNQTLEFSPVFEGGAEAAAYKYVLAQTKYYNQYEGMDDAQMAEELFFGTSSSIKYVTAEELNNGVLYVEGHSYGYPYYFAIVPIDAEGNPGASAAIMEYECVFEMAEVITEGEAFEATKPAVKVNFPADSEFYPDYGYGDAAYYGYAYSEWDELYQFYYEINYEVTPAEGTSVCAVLVDTETYELADDAALVAGNVWAGVYGSWKTVTFNEWGETSFSYYNHYENMPAPAVVLAYSWTDAEGNYYYDQIDLQPEFEKYAQKMKDMIYGGGSDTPAELTVEGKQWEFQWDAMGIGMRLDVGVSVPSYCMMGYDMELMYGPEAAGLWMAYIEGYYEIETIDETSGNIWLMTADMVTGDFTRGTAIAYSDLTIDSVVLNCPDFMIENVTATVCADTVTIQSQGIGGW